MRKNIFIPINTATTRIDRDKNIFIPINSRCTTRRLRELQPGIRCISLQPDGPFHGLEGWKDMATAMRPAIYDEALADENLRISTEGAYKIVKRAAREEGLLLSPSAGAALLGSLQVAARIPQNEQAVIVTVFADSAAKYLNERFWEE